jgi:ech hydrogenase subunit B
MNSALENILKALAILIAAGVIGGLLSGLDRVVSAKMQRRAGPPLLQPFYDVVKLLQKKATTVNQVTRFYVTLNMIFAILTVVLLFMGFDLLLCIFAFTLAEIFFVVAGYSSRSPYSFVGAERELVQLMCYEPMVLITAFAFYGVTGSFSAASVFELSSPAILKLPFVFLGLLYVLTIKLRKSPFDLSMSHHGHQEIVKGISTELTGICLAMVEITHWFETIFALALVFIFFAFSAHWSVPVSLVVCFAVFLLETLIDNVYARVKWRTAITSSWLVITIASVANFIVVFAFK